MSTRITLTLSLVLTSVMASGAPLSATQAYPAIGAKLRAQALARQDAGAPPEDVVAGLTRAALMDPAAADTWSALADAVGRLEPAASVPTRAERVAWRIAEAAGATPDPGIVAAAHVAPSPIAVTADPQKTGVARAIREHVGAAHRDAAGVGRFMEQVHAGVAGEWIRIRKAHLWGVLRVAGANWERDFRSGLMALHPYRPSLLLVAVTLLALLGWARSRHPRSGARERAAHNVPSRLQEARRLARSGAQRTDVARSTGLARDAIELLAPQAPRPDRSSVSGRNFRTELALRGIVPGRLNHVIA